jgi:hypothetical protein
MKYALLFLLLSASGDTLAPVPGSPAYSFASLSLCEETRDNRIVRESYREIYGERLVMACVMVERGR